MQRIHTTGRMSGATGMTMALCVVFGWSMVGMKNGASGVMTGAGNTTEPGKCLE